MDKRGSIEMIILGIVAVIAVIGLVLLFKGMTGKATGQPMTRDVLTTSEPFRIERPGGYACGCTGVCVYDGRTERAQAPITATQGEAEKVCRTTIERRCSPQPVANFNFGCGTR